MVVLDPESLVQGFVFLDAMGNRPPGMNKMSTSSRKKLRSGQNMKSDLLIFADSMPGIGKKC